MLITINGLCGSANFSNMIKVIKIVRTYEDGHRDFEKPEYLTFVNKKQMETYRCYLKRANNSISNVFFTYEEY
jgi:hypothetical protein